MAEPVGLALGGVALASLFSTCLEFLNYFELGRSYEYDYSMACVKLSLLRTRLDSWGDVLGVGRTGHESSKLRQNWRQERDVIARSLLGIKNILEDVEMLKEKYKLMPRSSSNTLRSLVTRAKREQGARGRFSLFHRSTKWAIRDEERFDVFLKDLEFFISNLESVQSRLNLSARPTQQSDEMDLKDAHNNSTNGSTPQSPHTGTRTEKKENRANESQEKSAQTQESTKNLVSKQFDQTHVFQNTEHGQDANTRRPTGNHLNEIGEMRNQSTASQGPNSPEHVTAVFTARAMPNVSPAPKRTGSGERVKTNFTGAGRQL